MISKNIDLNVLNALPERHRNLCLEECQEEFGDGLTTELLKKRVDLWAADNEPIDPDTVVQHANGDHQPDAKPAKNPKPAKNRTDDQIAEIRRALEVATPSGGLIEIRALDVPTKGRPCTLCGYFDDYDLAAREAARLDKQGPSGIYITLNPIKPELKARASNRMIPSPKHSTADCDVIRRDWLLIDLDPDRIPGISASDEEKRAAVVVAGKCMDFLTSRGWPEPIMADSGNGRHLLYRIDLPNDEDARDLVKTILEVLEVKAEDWQDGHHHVSVDKSVFNAARICKLYGTTARKGDSMDDRPHRMSKIMATPDTVEIVPTDKLRELAGERVVNSPAPLPAANANGDYQHRLMVDRYLSHYGRNFRLKDSRDSKGRDVYLLERCPFNDQHGPSKEVAIMQGPDGKLGALCMHNGCTGKGWHEFKAAIGEPLADHYDPPLTGRNGAAKNQGVNSTLISATDIEADPLPEPVQWPKMDEDAYEGIVGAIVREIEPQTEADPVAILLQLLVFLGNMFGRHAHFVIEGTRHYPNLFSVLVGQTAKGRKGTSEGRVRQVLSLVDEKWVSSNIHTGLVSGEGLIWSVRDPIYKIEYIKDHGRIISTEQVLDDPGVVDKRCLVIENEFASTLRVCKRETNTLSPTMRSAWDSGVIRTMAKNSPAKATDAHISVVGHITQEELRSCLTMVDSFNGFANRFLWALVRRSKLLPEGGRDLDLSEHAQFLALAVEKAKTIGRMQRDKAATALWWQVYPELADDTATGLWAAVTSRAEAQVLRMSMIYALLDGTDTICVEHLKAALAVWRYCRQSARIIFGNASGDPLAERIVEIIQQQPGISRKGIYQALGNHTKSEVLVAALVKLRDAGRIRVEKVQHPGGGRPSESWFVCEHCEHCEETPQETTRNPAEGINSHTSQSSRRYQEFDAFNGQADCQEVSNAI